MRELWLFLLYFFSIFWVYWATSAQIHQKHVISAKDEVKRLSKVTLKLYSSGRPPSGEDFWKSVGMSNPIVDPWGTPFRLTILSNEVFQWRSAGKDQQFETADDVILDVPYGEALKVDFSSEPLEPQGLPSTDVR